MEKAKELIANAENLAIIMHTKPDGDTIGSALSLYYTLIKENKKVELLCDDVIPSKFDFIMPKCGLSDADKPKYDLIVSIDCSDVERLGKYYDIYRKTKNTVCFDHHKTNTRFAKHVVLRANYASTAELMFEFLEYYNRDLIDKRICECVYIGIVTDSGGFCYPEVSSNTHLIAARLYEYGINANYLYNKVFRSKSMKRFKLHMRAVSRARFYNDNAIALVCFFEKDFEETNTDISDTEGCINIVQNIDEVKISIAVTEAGKDCFKISFRSSEELDVSECAGVFGGGGHKNASGCKVYGPFEEVVERVVKAARDIL